MKYVSISRPEDKYTIQAWLARIKDELDWIAICAWLIFITYLTEVIHRW